MNDPWIQCAAGSRVASITPDQTNSTVNTTRCTLPLPTSSDQGGPHTGDPGLCCLVKGEEEGPGLVLPWTKIEGRDKGCPCYAEESEHSIYPDTAVPWDSACAEICWWEKWTSLGWPQNGKIHSEIRLPEKPDAESSLEVPQNLDSE